ncbi:hypothetical protein RGQ29_008978 [Quercus rubra]|uniref:Oligopeptide transporter 4 n=1 Tax=Quercus rubra TaxID=3512 RepID=A0AAN7E1R3_QUERU|nr:hypothetical protein RGQ29_008978 [Quercus rubra]
MLDLRHIEPVILAQTHLGAQSGSCPINYISDMNVIARVLVPANYNGFKVPRNRAHRERHRRRRRRRRRVADRGSATDRFERRRPEPSSMDVSNVVSGATIVCAAVLSEHFFQYRTEPLVISMISVQVGTLPIGRFMANVLPTTTFRIPGFGEREFSLNPGPFNMKEHVLISIFANAGSAFGSGAAYAISIVDIIRAFYHRKISFLASWILVITTQVLGYGWAGILRKYLVDPAQMWWPSSLVQVSLFRAMHEKDNSRMSRGKFFLIALICSFSWYLIPGYLFPLLSTISWVCWAFPKSLTAHQIGFRHATDSVLDHFPLDWDAYISVYFCSLIRYWFAGIISTLTHVALFNGRDIYAQFRASYSTGKQDIHTRLMRKYKDIPSWWFYVMLMVSLILALILCIFMIDEIQMPWWGLIFAAGLAVHFHSSSQCHNRHTNQTNSQCLLQDLWVYKHVTGYFLSNDFKLGHYMKIPPRSMFIVQFIGTIIAGTVNLGVAWWLLNTIENICQDELLPPNSPWTCPGDRVFFDASVIWGLVGPRRIFGRLGNYPALNWFFLGGAVGPVIVWLMQKAFPNQEWISLINLPVLLGATAAMPPATSVNFNCWIVVGTIFNYFVFKYRKNWWQRYKLCSFSSIGCRVAFMGVILYFTLTMEDISLSWWGSDGGERCELATCPTAKGIVVDGCPVF